MAPKITLRVLVLVVIIHLKSLVIADMFTAITEMEPLLETYKMVLDDLDNYVSKEEKRLFTLKKQLDSYKKEHNKAMEDIPNYLGNPINAFTLIKRLTSDKDHIEQSIQLGTENVRNISMTHEGVKYPTREDLVGATQALARLQDTYRLKVNDLSAGILNGVVYSSPMSAGDCFELGRGLYNQKEYSYCIAWMKEALEKYRNASDEYPFDEVDILEYITFSYYLTGDMKSALEWTKKSLEIEPGHNPARDNVPRYEKKILENEKMLKRRKQMDIEKDNLAKMPKKVNHTLAAKKYSYQDLCRGEVDISTEISKGLKCWYVTKNHPFLRLAPLKVEQMYIQPDVFIFHQVISDDEIEQIKTKAKPKFKRATVHDSQTGNATAASYRISKSAWLDDDESPAVARLTQRVADMTGLSVDTSEELQVLNYGIGGHYVPHVDFVRMNEKSFNASSDKRIATVLFYMSDVPQGGATVFPELGVSVFPEKNSALFWMNLHPSGEGDMATRHAACPVLRGSKWVSTKWIHLSGQTFIRPCNLQYQREGILRQLPQPIPKRMAVVT